MGLLSKVIKSVGRPLGIVKNKAGTAIGAIKTSKVGKAIQGATAVKAVAKVAAPVAKVGLRVGKFAIKRAGVIGAGITVAGLAVSGVKKLKGRKDKPRSPIVSPTAQAGERKTSLGRKLLTGAVVATGAGALAYGAEQLAEKLGVRGGAGFIGRRKKKRTTRKRSRKSRRSRSSRRKPKFGTKAWMAYIRSKRGKGRRSTLSYRRKRGRSGKGVSKTELSKIRALIRRSERD